MTAHYETSNPTLDTNRLLFLPATSTDIINRIISLPDSCTAMRVMAWGAGGGGCYKNLSNGFRAGGGGGGYAESFIKLKPNRSQYINVRINAAGVMPTTTNNSATDGGFSAVSLITDGIAPGTTIVNACGGRGANGANSFDVQQGSGGGLYPNATTGLAQIGDITYFGGSSLTESASDTFFGQRACSGGGSAAGPWGNGFNGAKGIDSANGGGGGGGIGNSGSSSSTGVGGGGGGSLKSNIFSTQPQIGGYGHDVYPTAAGIGSISTFIKYSDPLSPFYPEFALGSGGGGGATSVEGSNGGPGGGGGGCGSTASVPIFGGNGGIFGGGGGAGKSSASSVTNFGGSGGIAAGAGGSVFSNTSTNSVASTAVIYGGRGMVIIDYYFGN